MYVSRLWFFGNSYVDGQAPVQTSFPFRFTNGVINHSFIVPSVGLVVVLVVVTWIVGFLVVSGNSFIVDSVNQILVAFNIVSFVGIVAEDNIVEVLAVEAVDAV